MEIDSVTAYCHTISTIIATSIASITTTLAKTITTIITNEHLTALCSYPHVNVDIRDLSQTFTTAPIFAQYNYFRQNIWGNI